MTDDFNRADSTDLGANWTEQAGNWQITSQTLRNASTGGDAVVTYTGTYTNVETSAKVKFTSAAGTISIGARLGSYSGGVPAAGYAAELSSTGLVKLWRVSDWAELGSYQIANYQSGTFTTLLLSASGSALVVKVDGTTRISVNDSTFTSGSVGLWSYDATAANQHVIDDFNLVVLGQGNLPGGLLAAWWEGVKDWIGGGKLAAPAALKPQPAVRQSNLAVDDTLGAPVEVPPTGRIYRSYYFVGSVRVAMREFTGSVSVVSYILTDHLGSTSMTLDASGIPVSTTLYKPWGETRYSGGTASTDYKYTGQMSLDIGIYFYGARNYDPLIGRFLSADSIVPDLYNSIDLDRYAYVRNTPLNLVDPYGYSVTKYLFYDPDVGTNLLPPKPKLPGLRQSDPANSTYEEIGKYFKGNPWNVEDILPGIVYAEFGSLISTDGTNLPDPVIETLARRYNEYCAAGSWTNECIIGFWTYFEVIRTQSGKQMSDKLRSGNINDDPERVANLTVYLHDLAQDIPSQQVKINGGAISITSGIDWNRPAHWCTLCTDIVAYLKISLANGQYMVILTPKQKWEACGNKACNLSNAGCLKGGSK